MGNNIARHIGYKISDSLSDDTCYGLYALPTVPGVADPSGALSYLRRGSENILERFNKGFMYNISDKVFACVHDRMPSTNASLRLPGKFLVIKDVTIGILPHITSETINVLTRFNKKRSVWKTL